MPIHNVGVLVETDTSWGRNLLRGVASYAARFGPWKLLAQTHHSFIDCTIPESWRIDGLIVRISTPLLLERLQSLHVPIVDVGDLFVSTTGIDSVVTDYNAWADQALEHFRSKGFTNFAYYAPPSRDYSNLRGDAFAAAVDRHGLVCARYRPGYRIGRQISPDEHRRRVTRWLGQLPQPVAILAADAVRGKDLAEVCVQAGLAVPDTVGILAGDSDELTCEICTPPLSSIEVAGRRIGYEAAALLADRLAGGSCLSSSRLVEPDGVQSRQSTDVLAIDDPLVVRALRFMHQNSFRGITVLDVLQEVPVARRQLERQFKRYLGRLPAEELRRLRLERARQLLAESEMSIDDVAEASGYAGSTQLGAAFRKQFRITPLAYRKRSQAGPA
ncbi:AraC family transcriptional regulator [Botrimarina hoheduenensis]|uniref:Xylose operon regulatory protein n=1 Tax=Botrimarina hoheduenensis TaxID=2528000 RepID=A0A5C5WBL2_9BACT|nr:DNA-binding transcriptional regulator [Botrimarina hoheduenensis]TWT48288.1 Xylose operon regulatory protein [Botrimarina hoheduenensis]